MTTPTPEAKHQKDAMDAARARALLVTLGQTGDLAQGSSLPPFAHHIYFWDAQPASNLGRDGHPAVGGFIPDMGLPRRMWAAGKLVSHAPLRLGIEAERITTIEAVTRKDGASGPLAFVRLRHDFRQRHTLCQSEWQELVYRQDLDPSEPKPTTPTAPTDETDRKPFTADVTLLFRYSALTFNGHRIHYDLEYARDVEGYGGLVVHGPLLAQMLALLAQEKLGMLTNFAYRATAPLIAGEPAWLCWRDDGRLWVRGADGRQCMTADAS